MSVTYLSMSSNRLYLTPHPYIAVYKALFFTHLLMHIYSCINLYINVHIYTKKSHTCDSNLTRVCILLSLSLVMWDHVSVLFPVSEDSKNVPD